MHAADLANVVEALPPERVGDFLRALSPNRAAQVIEYLDENCARSFSSTYQTEQAAEIISEMTPMTGRTCSRRSKKKPRTRSSPTCGPGTEETEKLLQYEPDTAGGLMTTGFVSVQESDSIEAALGRSGWRHDPGGVSRCTRST